MPEHSPTPTERRRAPMAFTLIELIVVIVITGVLATLAFPIFQRIAQGSKAAACISNLRQLGAGLNLYLGEHNMTMPVMMAGRSDIRQDVPVLDNTLSTQVTDPRVFACPADAKGIAKATGTSYFWNPALNGQNAASLNFLKIADATRIPILSDKEGFHPYQPSQVNILYADGHATQSLQFSTGQ
jgi:prepilin-type N-terminal cleavage/methylation domain-containing protein/prepilin-type processing-associated H-X9-DG protein